MMEKLSKFETVDIISQDVKTKLKYDNASSKRKKLILIQTPVNFDINSLTGLQIPLNGAQNLPSHEDSDKRYELRSNMNCKKNMDSMNVLIPSFEEKKLCVARPFYGNMLVTQSVLVPPVLTPDREEVILPTVPDKLIHKWTPFGAGNPKILTKRKATKRKKDKSKKSLKEASLKTLNLSSEEIIGTDRTEIKHKKKKKHRKKEAVDS